MGTRLVYDDQSFPDVKKLVYDSEPFSVSKTVGNFPSDLYNVGKNIFSAIRHPIDTASTLTKFGGGALSKIFPGKASSPGDVEAEQAFDLVANSFKEKYGSLDNFKKTVQEHPAEVMMDLSAILGGAGGAVGKLGEISDISAISRAGSLASKAGEAVNPISQIFGAGAKVVRGAAELGAQGLGFTSQMGKNAAKEIFNSAGAPKVVEAMRGKVPGEKIFNEAEESLAIMRENASSKFRGKLEELDKVKANLNPGLVKDALEDRLAKFKISRDSSGALDFSRSPIAGDPHAVQSVQTAVKFVDDFGSQAGDFTPSGFDNLKQRLDNIFSASSQSKAFTTPLRKAAFKTIEDAVPDYALWEKDYSVFKDLSGELEKAFSLKDSASANTAIGKLTNALGKNSEFKQTLLNRMESASGKEITQQIAGKAASQVFPERGIVGAILGSATASSYFSKAAGTKILALFPLASPRIVGEFLNVLGVAKNTTEKILKTIRADKLAKPSTIQAAFQSGRVNESVPEKKKLVFGGQ